MRMLVCKVLGKSCKMVPVFIAGIAIANKAAEYSFMDYLQVNKD